MLSIFKKITATHVFYGLLVANFALLLFFGLDIKGQPFKNTIQLDAAEGLVFGNRSFGLLTLPASQLGTEEALAKELLIEISVKPSMTHNNSRDIVRLFFDGSVEDDITVFQWRDTIIFSLGSDYDFAKKIPRVFSRVKQGQQTLRFCLSERKMRLYNDGVLVAVELGSGVHVPTVSEGATIKLGGYGSYHKSWHGSIASLVVAAGCSLGTREAGARYDFVAMASQQAGGIPLVDPYFSMPSLPISYDRGVLGAPELPMPLSRVALVDIIINILGFIPTGFLLFLLIQRRVRRLALMVVWPVLLGFCISLFIEYAQSWLPMRDSSSLDLLLNVMGALIGALLALVFRKKFMFLCCNPQ